MPEWIDFTLIYANDHYYALHGFTREKLRNEFNNRTIHLVHPADIPFIERRLHKAVEQKEQTVSLEYRVVRPDGEVVWLLMNGSLSEQQGNMLLTGMVIDISHQKFMEERLCCKVGGSARCVPKKSGGSQLSTNPASSECVFVTTRGRLSSRLRNGKAEFPFRKQAVFSRAIKQRMA